MYLEIQVVVNNYINFIYKSIILILIVLIRLSYLILFLYFLIIFIKSDILSIYISLCKVFSIKSDNLNKFVSLFKN